MKEKGKRVITSIPDAITTARNNTGENNFIEPCDLPNGNGKYCPDRDRTGEKPCTNSDGYIPDKWDGQPIVLCPRQKGRLAVVNEK